MARYPLEPSSTGFISARMPRRRGESKAVSICVVFRPDRPEGLQTAQCTRTLRNCHGSDCRYPPGTGPAGRPAGSSRCSVLHRAEIGHLHFKAALVVHLVRLDDAGVADFPAPRPCPPAPPRSPEGRWRSGRARMRRVSSSESRAVPVGVLLMAIEQHAELIDAVDQLVFVEHMQLDCALPPLPNISCSDSTASLAGW
jgi:hypothetical protein